MQKVRLYLKTDWLCVHNRLFNANFEAKFKKTPVIILRYKFYEVNK
jgi:hypothetical protein